MSEKNNKKQDDLLHKMFVDNRRIKALEEALRETRESLQTTIEELKTSNEELHTSNEELQSTNEELHAVNQEVAVKNAEIEASNKRLTNEIEERQRAEDLVVEQERKLRMIINSEPAWVNICDSEGTILEVNPAGVEIMEADTEQELIGKNLLDLVMDKHKQDLRACQELVAVGETHKQAVAVKTLKGNTRWLEISTVRLPDEVNNKVQIMSIICDQTHFKEAHDKVLQGQTELAHVMRLNTLGAMASGLAHELNQPLSSIANYLSGCERRVRNNSCQQEEVLDVLSLANIQVQRAGEIINQVKHFIKQDGRDTEAVDVNAAIENAIELARGTGQCNHARIELAFTEPLAPVLANKVQIEQVIINLVLNGIEAMDEAGINQPVLFIRTRLAGEKIEVMVEDSGTGLSAGDKIEIFKPFHSTKANGMGMGLCVSRSIIELYMGQLYVVDRVGGGTIFRFELPIYPQ